jgi:hypothetical protein
LEPPLVLQLPSRCTTTTQKQRKVRTIKCTNLFLAKVMNNNCSRTMCKRHLMVKKIAHLKKPTREGPDFNNQMSQQIRLSWIEVDSGLPILVRSTSRNLQVAKVFAIPIVLRMLLLELHAE